MVVAVYVLRVNSVSEFDLRPRANSSFPIQLVPASGPMDTTPTPVIPVVSLSCQWTPHLVIYGFSSYITTHYCQVFLQRPHL